MCRFLSWGVGVQSTTLLAMSALGELPRLDAAIFADTQWERAATYASLEFYMALAEEHGIATHVITEGNIREKAAREHVHMPFWTETGAPLQRQCTQHFKIEPIRRAMRVLAGYDRSQPPHPSHGEFDLWLGISLDEWTRATEDKRKFIRHIHPLLDLRMTRQDCEDWLIAHGLPVPEKSACIGCPFRSASEWSRMRQGSPKEWADAVQFDEENRNNPLARRKGDHSTADGLYVWKKAIPLADVDLEAEAARERTSKQLPLMCGAFCMA